MNRHDIALEMLKAIAHTALTPADAVQRAYSLADAYLAARNLPPVQPAISVPRPDPFDTKTQIPFAPEIR